MKRRRGLTFVELLVAIGTIGVLVALALPAIQSAREASRKTVCQNNLRQLALAVQNHDAAEGALPPLYNGTHLSAPRHGSDAYHFHSWRSKLLPHLGEQNTFEALAWSRPASDLANQTALNTTVPTFGCPSRSAPTPNLPIVVAHNDGRYPTWSNGGTAAVSDYEVILAFLEKNDVPDGRFWMQPGFQPGAWPVPRASDGPLGYSGDITARLQDISDGQSQTLLMGERAGRPDLYQSGVLVDQFPHEPGVVVDTAQAAWGLSTHVGWLLIYRDSAINVTNGTGLYSFHRSGAFAACADGSVHFLSETMDLDTLGALCTRAGGDLVSGW